MAGDQAFKDWVAGLTSLSGTSIVGTDTLPVVRSGVTYKATGTQILPAAGTVDNVPTAEFAYRYVQDFYSQTTLTATTTQQDTSYVVTGTSAAVAFSNTQIGITGSASQAIGSASLQVGTTTSGKAQVYCMPQFRLDSPPSGSEVVANIRAALDNGGLSTATNRYTSIVGFGTSNMTGQTYSDNLQGCYFRYSDDINSGKWQAVICNGTSKTVVDTGITVAASTWYEFKIRVDPRTSGGNGIRFYINGTLVATIAATDTFFATNKGLGSYIYCGQWARLGTGTGSLTVDYMEAFAYRS